MSWSTVKLNDGVHMPLIAYGHNYWVGQEKIVGDVGTALEVGFEHLDTAQGYYDEDKFAQAIKESGLQRSDLFITTKWSRGDTNIRDACENSLVQLGTDHVDLYLIHNPAICKGDIVGRWKQMEEVKRLGYTRSIGVSNYDIHDLKVLMASATITPSVNQIAFDPEIYAESTPLVKYCAEHGILIEAYSPLMPIRVDPHGAVARTVREIAEKLKVEDEQVLLVWVRAKGAAVVTSSGRKSRMESYIAAGDMSLSKADEEALDQAGWAAVKQRRNARRYRQKMMAVVAIGSTGLAMWRLLA